MIQEIYRIPLEGVHNTRDLGGYKTKDGRKIKAKSLIRSGDLHDLTKTDREILTGEYELATIVDFRTDTEQKERPDPVLPGVAYVSNPILEEKMLGITREKETDQDVVGMVLEKLKGNVNAGIAYMENMYSNLITDDFSKKQYANFFRILSEQKKGAVLWHCTAGKDRVGTGTALLLEILGVSREQIIADYLKVNEFASQEINNKVEELIEKTGDLQLGEQLRTLFSVRESYIQTIFQIIEKEYGNIESYMMEEMGMTRDFFPMLREKYLQ